MAGSRDMFTPSMIAGNLIHALSYGEVRHGLDCDRCIASELLDIAPITIDFSTKHRKRSPRGRAMAEEL